MLFGFNAIVRYRLSLILILWSLLLILEEMVLSLLLEETAHRPVS